MSWLKRKSDPISSRSRSLRREIAALESQIQQLNQRLDQPPGVESPRENRRGQEERGAGRGGQPELIFEPVEGRSQTGQGEAAPAHYNALGVRKYDLVALWQRMQSQFRGPPASNPKLVNYLAVGSIKGLRPLRYEKRVARNRFVALFICLTLLLWGVVAIFFRSHSGGF